MSITVKDLSYVYNPKSPYETVALDGITLEIKTGEFVAVCGRTGSGKTTFVQHLNALVTPQSGELVVEGLNLTEKNKKLRREMLKKLRGKVGMVFQYPEYQLFAGTVYEDVAFGPTNMGLPKEEIDDRVRTAIKAVGLDFERISHQSPFEISGGEKRRAALAGVLAMNPNILVLDEPTAGLDPLGKEEILNLVVKLNKENGLTVIMVSHDVNEVYEYTDRTIVFSQGKVLFNMATRDLFTRVDVANYGLEEPQLAILSKILAKNGIVLKGENRNVKDMAAAILAYTKEGGNNA
ncbi:MAG: energy-coupling factor transporter ATPase [Clostridiales bacterium]|nr:energy-coupling factor transporter ATPase [Clostridiales bacterium]MDY5726094.1 energy-coupling factor transporter ATPase [Eubacteriales bacterium]